MSVLGSSLILVRQDSWNWQLLSYFGEGDHIPGKRALKDMLVKINKFNY